MTEVKVKAGNCENCPFMNIDNEYGGTCKHPKAIRNGDIIKDKNDSKFGWMSYSDECPAKKVVVEFV